MKRVLISVEGQTEEEFIKEVLQPHLRLHNLYLEPTLVTTKVVRSGPHFNQWLTWLESL